MRLVKKLEENSVLIFSLLFFFDKGAYLLGKTTTKYKIKKEETNDDFVFNGR